MTTLLTDLASVQTLPQLLAWRAARTPGAEAYRAFDASCQRWISLTWAQTQERVVHWSRALATMALPRGARVAILLPNGLNAMSIDQATLALGHVPVPLHAIDNPASIAYILADCQASLLLVDDLAQWQRIQALETALPELRAVLVTAPGAVSDLAAPVPVLALADWLTQARQRPLMHTPPCAVDMAAIVYTSGTTGKPKGVVLTHRNVVADVKAVLARIQPLPSDVFLSFLPLSHTFERTGGYYLPMAAGSCVAYARSVALLSEDLQTVQPTVLVSVPRIYERVYAKVQERLAPSRFKSRLFEVAVEAGWRRFRAIHGLPAPADEAPRSTGLWSALPWFVLEALVAKPLMAQFGGRVRVAVSGGAPLSPTIAQCFLGLGLPVLQGYGMTETSPVVSVNTLKDNRPDSVGRALPGVEVRIGENRELQVRGDIVMKGYWNRPEDTARTLSHDGWLATGDQADFIDGRIYIRGRIKEIIVTSTGEKVPPADLELAISADPLFSQVFVVGDNRPFITCVAVLEASEWQRLAAELGLDANAPASLSDPHVLRTAVERITHASRSFPRYAMPRAVHLTLTPWTIENTFMTPTLKLKRNNLMGYFAQEIDAIYAKPNSKPQA
ncbi:AMP-dependent synthetase/ligase [Simplicispira psychrophila]|uniref:AMP-dependent synthetase/ligase n=1 Tax=Simplicispira psychrophila TaxID=80882 RepID=UPI000485EB65|nr:AMP-dependent synthetase/ligase [Simplicispira psychrophila]